MSTQSANPFIFNSCIVFHYGKYRILFIDSPVDGVEVVSSWFFNFNFFSI